jgi:lipopolysaccharide export LptBFGC system permease protein LptF
MTRALRPLVQPGLVLALLSLLIAPAMPASAQTRQEETFDRTLTLQPGGTFRLRTFSGRVTIRGGDGNQVVIHAIRRARPDRLRDIQIEVTQSGNDIEVNANHQAVERDNDNVVETDFDIQVPARTRLDVNSFSAPIEVTNVQGAHRLKTFSADIRLAAESWNEQDGLDADSFSGNVRLRLPGNARGAISFDSFSGRFESDLPVTLQASNRRTFRGDLNGGGSATFRFKTFSGSAEIRK